MTKFFIDQHGCAKNQTDGELIVGYLTKNGFEFTYNAEEADFIIVNSCGFIESAKKESIDAIYNIKAAYPDAKLILAGCLAERYSQMLFDSMPELDGIFGNGDISKIVDFMKSVEKERTVVVCPQEEVCGGNRPTLFNFPGSAFVKITEGCSNHCSFCAIPIIRGELRSRNESEILQEITALVEDGVYEINLIGQDLAAYGTEKTFPVENKDISPLANLFKKISNIEGDFIIRPLYIHPDHFNADILEVMKKDKRFIPYFDIPFQSGDNEIIKKMNRVGSQDKYIQLVNNIRSYFPEAVLRTTFLTGFPGESDEAADNTYNFLNTIEPHWSGCFPYSREENTPAYDMKGKIPAKTAKKRAEKLETRQTEITVAKLEKYIGQKLNVLIEEIIQVDSQVAEDVTEGLAIGRAWFQAPDVDGCVVIRYDRDIPADMDAIVPGNVVEVKILTSTGVDLDGRFEKLVRNKKVVNRKFIM